MQVIDTDKAEGYIDNMPGKRYGHFKNKDAADGFDWKAHIGETVHGITVIPDSGHMWLNKHKQ